MFSTADAGLIEGSYVWTYPGCPLRILLSLNTLERIRSQICGDEGSPSGAAAPTSDRSFGGLLIGRVEAKGSITEVVDFVPLPAPQDPSNPPLNLLTEWMRVIGTQCQADCKVVGYFRTTPEDAIRLSVNDLQLIQRCFNNRTDVFLLIGPAKLNATAAFFCWNNGAISDRAQLTFPFSPDALASGRWPIEGGHAFVERLSSVAGLLTSAFERPGIPAKVVSVALVIALLAIGGRLIWHPGADASGSGVALRVERTGQSFILSWDQSPAVRNAKAASLEVREPGKENSLLVLTPDQLHAGTLTYGSYPYTEDTQFALKLGEIQGPLPPEASAAALPPDTEEAAPREGVHELPARPAPAARNENYPAAPTEVKRRLDRLAALSAADDDVAEPPRSVRLNPRPALRAFVPPDTKPAPPAAPDPELLDPPSIGRIFTSPATVPLVLANAVPQDAAVPPKGPRPLEPNSPAIRVVATESAGGQLMVTSEPSGAAVSINEVFAGVTPLSLQISPVGLGFTVTVTKSGFAKWTIQSVATDQPYSLHARLRPQ